MVGEASWLVLLGAIGDASERISPKPAQGDRKVENSTLRFAAFTPDPILWIKTNLQQANRKVGVLEKENE